MAALHHWFARFSRPVMISKTCECEEMSGASSFMSDWTRRKFTSPSRCCELSCFAARQTLIPGIVGKSSVEKASPGKGIWEKKGGKWGTDFFASGSENNFHKYGAPASRHSPFNRHLKRCKSFKLPFWPLSGHSSWIGRKSVFHI